MVFSLLASTRGTPAVFLLSSAFDYEHVTAAGLLAIGSTFRMCSRDGPGAPRRGSVKVWNQGARCFHPVLPSVSRIRVGADPIRDIAGEMQPCPTPQLFQDNQYFLGLVLISAKLVKAYPSAAQCDRTGG